MAFYRESFPTLNSDQTELFTVRLRGKGCEVKTNLRPTLGTSLIRLWSGVTLLTSLVVMEVTRHMWEDVFPAHGQSSVQAILLLLLALGFTFFSIHLYLSKIYSLFPVPLEWNISWFPTFGCDFACQYILYFIFPLDDKFIKNEPLIKLIILHIAPHMK